MKGEKPARSRLPMQHQRHTAKTGAPLDRNVQAKIGQQLRAMYDDVVKQGVPDRFNELLRKLGESEKPGGEGSGA